MKRLATLLITLAPLAVAAQTQGVSKDEIVVGTIQDLSGPLAALGTHFRNSLQMRFDEVNAEGGIHGRKIKLVAEDSGYDPKKGVLAAQKLVQRDKVFAAVSNLGSPVMLATMPLFLERKVLHLFPAAAHPSAYEPLHKWRVESAFLEPDRALEARHRRRRGSLRRGRDLDPGRDPGARRARVHGLSQPAGQDRRDRGRRLAAYRRRR